MKSALYTGWIQHRRFGPSRNAFRYPLYMSYLDLAELPTLFRHRWLWSATRPALAWFRRADHLGPPDLPLDTAVRDLVQASTGKRPEGPIRLLTHLRHFGYAFNPVSFFYLFDAADSHVETIVADITNTPWRERHAYLPLSQAVRRGARAWRFRFDKQFHVSPFMPMEQRYDWCFGAPGAGIHVHMENFARLSPPDAAPLFDATLHLRREEMTAATMARALLRFPFTTLRVTTLIYWQALKLALKRVPFHIHPGKQRTQTQE
jgi:DUF1365 family protein